MFGLPNTRYAAKGYIGDIEGTLSSIIVEAANADDLLVLWWLGHNWPSHTFNNTRIEVAYGSGSTFTDMLLVVTLKAAGGVIDLPFEHGLYDPAFRGSDMRVFFEWDTTPTNLSDGRPHAVIG
jgi:hypothetical protein